MSCSRLNLSYAFLRCPKRIGSSIRPSLGVAIDATVAEVTSTDALQFATPAPPLGSRGRLDRSLMFRSVWSMPSFGPRDRVSHEHPFRSLGKLVIGNLDRIADVDNVGN